jgi:hypothetical protein
LGGSVFHGTNIAELILPEGLEYFGGWNFAYTRVKSIIIPDSVTKMGDFGLASSLEQIIVSENHPLYRTIDGNLYSKDGTKLIQYAPGKNDKSFIVPSHVTTLCKGAFYSCKLENLTITKNVKEIEAGCSSAWSSNLKNVIFENQNDWFLYEGETLIEAISVTDSLKNAMKFAQGMNGSTYTWKNIPGEKS